MVKRMNINYWEFKKALEKTEKSYFHISDLIKFYSSSKASLKVLLSQWCKKNFLYHLGQGYYSLDVTHVDYLALAQELDAHAYLSLESALSWHHLIDQVPSVVTMVTSRRTRKYSLGAWLFSYTHLKPALMFSYEMHKTIYVATPEKALADCLYLIARGQRMVDLSTLDKTKLDQKKFNHLLKKFPPYVIKKREELYL